jgi:Clostridium P-47 protein
MSTTPGNGTEPTVLAETYDWDCVFAIDFANANAALSANWGSVSESVKQVDEAAEEDPSYHLRGTFGPWQLTLGGDGRNLRMQCPFVSGAYQAGARSYSLEGTGTAVVIEVDLAWVPDPGQKSFVVSGESVRAIATALGEAQIAPALRTAFANAGISLEAGASVLPVLRPGREWAIGDGTAEPRATYYLFLTTDRNGDEFLNVLQFERDLTSQLRILAEAAEADEPAVTIVQIVNDPAGGLAGAALSELLSTWFNTHVADFNYVFAALDLAVLVDTADHWQWTKPTATSYAVTDQGTMESSVFAVLTMTEERPEGANHQVSPNAIPPERDAAFLVSGERFMSQMMLAGARAVFDEAPASSFVITNDGLTVQSSEDLVLGTFDTTEPTAEEPTPQQISLTVTSGNFIISLNGSVLELQLLNVTYPYSDQFDVHVNYKERIELTLQQQGERQIFWFDRVNRSMQVTVTKTRLEITLEIVTGVVAGVLALIAVAGPIVEAMTAGAEVAADGAAGTAEISEEVAEEAAEADPEGAAEDDAEAGQAAADGLDGRTTPLGRAFSQTRWKVMGALAGVAGAGVAALRIETTIVESAAQRKWEAVPGFDLFADQVIAPYSWPGVAGYALKSAWLAGSLQIGLDIQRPA